MYCVSESKAIVGFKFLELYWDRLGKYNTSFQLYFRCLVEEHQDQMSVDGELLNDNLITVHGF